MIVTDYIFPPIPLRDFDWCAYDEDDAEAGNCGWGKTREEAIKNLKELKELVEELP
jgi:hypothetical protein